jgi:hypothetical protein
MNYSQPMIGISNSNVINKNGWLICKFTRLLKMPEQPFYYDLTQQNYVLAAFGPMNNDGGFC